MATKHQFILWVPFKAGPDFEARWDAQIDAHMAGATKLLAKGIIKLAGPAFVPGANLCVPWNEREKAASVMVYEAESLESARAIVEVDAFYSGGVWDTERLQLHPMLDFVSGSS